jgi:CRISPR-associated protein Csx14
MAESRIPVDLLNPGQVFACLGFMEAAEVLFGNAEGRFDWSSGKTEFCLRVDQIDYPFTVVLDFIKSAQYYSTSPDKTIQERDGGKTIYVEGVHPSRLLSKEGKLRNALLPIELSGSVSDGEVSNKKCFQFNYWGDLDSGRPIIRLWTATNGNSAWVRFFKLYGSYLIALKKYDEKKPDPLNLEAPVAANFRLEPRRNWKSIDIGFSPDVQQKAREKLKMSISVMTYPVVEIFSAFALTNARPKFIGGNNSVWKFSAWQKWLPVEMARIAIAQGFPLAETRNFIAYLETPNDGGDLSMTYALEELNT